MYVHFIIIHNDTDFILIHVTAMHTGRVQELAMTNYEHEPEQLILQSPLLFILIIEHLF